MAPEKYEGATNLVLVVVPLQLSAELFELLLQADSFAELSSVCILFLLQGVAAFFVLLVFSLDTTHIG